MPFLPLPPPDCEGAYTEYQVVKIFGDLLPEFHRWMVGQTMPICNGRRWDPFNQKYQQACGGISHGPCYYDCDVVEFAEGKDRGLENVPVTDW